VLTNKREHAQKDTHTQPHKHTRTHTKQRKKVCVCVVCVCSVCACVWVYVRVCVRVCVCSCVRGHLVYWRVHTHHIDILPQEAQKEYTLFVCVTRFIHMHPCVTRFISYESMSDTIHMSDVIHSY